MVRMIIKGLYLEASSKSKKLLKTFDEDTLKIIDQRKIECEKKLLQDNMKILSSVEDKIKSNEMLKYTVVYTIEKEVGEFVALESR